MFHRAFSKTFTALTFFTAASAALAGSDPSLGLCSGPPGALDADDWQVHAIGAIQVVDAYARHSPDVIPTNDDELADRKIGAPAVTPDILVNGTYYSWDGAENRIIIMGQVMRDGVLDYTLTKKSRVYGRAGLSISKGGKMAICNPAEFGGPIDQRVINTFCRADSFSPVWQYVGGAALMIYNGNKACVTNLKSGEQQTDGPCDASIDVTKVQNFWYGTDNQLTSSLEEGPFRYTQHMMFGTQGGQMYVIWNTSPRTGKQVQDELCAKGFDNLIKFDGGAGYAVLGSIDGANRVAGTERTGQAPTNGFLIKVK